MGYMEAFFEELEPYVDCLLSPPLVEALPFFFFFFFFFFFLPLIIVYSITDEST
jgi:hypothetical protein